MRPVSTLFMIIASYVLAGCAMVPSPSDSGVSAVLPPASGNYNIVAGDVLNITIFGHDDLSGEFTVDANGNITMPLINDIPASGLSTQDLGQRIAAALQPDYLRNPDVVVKLNSSRPIYILGEVQNAGSYPYQPNMSVLSAVALAGGYTYRAARNKLLVIRGDDQSREETRVLENTSLRPGDTVIVRQRIF